ncbi:MAG: helix-turn-helix domain-containing protein [Clostridiales bacterium]|nr:helix-turn-helix domain-containing protein [Clostridiales bacterium]
MLNIKNLRNRRNLSQSEVANALGVSLRAYQNYEYGQREPNIEIINKLADFYGVTTDYLLGRETGEAEPIDLLSTEFNMSALEKKIIDNYLSLPKNMRTDLMEFLHKSVKEVESEDD